jgi:hypothetical protein
MGSDVDQGWGTVVSQLPKVAAIGTPQRKDPATPDQLSSNNLWYQMNDPWFETPS